MVFLFVLLQCNSCFKTMVTVRFITSVLFGTFPFFQVSAELLWSVAVQPAEDAEQNEAPERSCFKTFKN